MQSDVVRFLSENYKICVRFSANNDPLLHSTHSGDISTASSSSTDLKMTTSDFVFAFAPYFPRVSVHGKAHIDANRSNLRTSYGSASSSSSAEEGETKIDSEFVKKFICIVDPLGDGVVSKQHIEKIISYYYKEKPHSSSGDNSLSSPQKIIDNNKTSPSSKLSSSTNSAEKRKSQPPSRNPPRPPSVDSRGSGSQALVQDQPIKLPSVERALQEAENMGDENMINTLKALSKWSSENLHSSQFQNMQGDLAQKLKKQRKNKNEMPLLIRPTVNSYRITPDELDFAVTKIKYTDTWIPLANALYTLGNDSLRGQAVSMLFRSQVASECEYFESLSRLPESLLPAELFQAWIRIPRVRRKDALNFISKTLLGFSSFENSQAPLEEANFYRQISKLSKSQIPLTTTTLQVEMNAAVRHVTEALHRGMLALLPNVLKEWQLCDESVRSTALLALLGVPPREEDLNSLSEIETHENNDKVYSIRKVPCYSEVSSIARSIFQAGSQEYAERLSLIFPQSVFDEALQRALLNGWAIHPADSFVTKIAGIRDKNEIPPSLSSDAVVGELQMEISQPKEQAVNQSTLTQSENEMQIERNLNEDSNHMEVDEHLGVRRDSILLVQQLLLEEQERRRQEELRIEEILQYQLEHVAIEEEQEKENSREIPLNNREVSQEVVQLKNDVEEQEKEDRVEKMEVETQDMVAAEPVQENQEILLTATATPKENEETMNDKDNENHPIMAVVPLENNKDNNVANVNQAVPNERDTQGGGEEEKVDPNQNEQLLQPVEAVANNNDADDLSGPNNNNENINDNEGNNRDAEEVKQNELDERDSENRNNVIENEAEIEALRDEISEIRSMAKNLILDVKDVVLKDKLESQLSRIRSNWKS